MFVSFPVARTFPVHCAALAFPSLRRFLTRRTCLLAPGKNSAAPERTFSSALVSAEWRAQRENDRRKERGIWAGHSKRIKEERMKQNTKITPHQSRACETPRS